MVGRLLAELVGHLPDIFCALVWALCGFFRCMRWLCDVPLRHDLCFYLSVVIRPVFFLLALPDRFLLGAFFVTSLVESRGGVAEPRSSCRCFQTVTRLKAFSQFLSTQWYFFFV